MKVYLSSPHLIVLSPEAEFVWRGSKEIKDFAVQAQAAPSPVSTYLSFNVSIGGVSVAKFLLDLEISSDMAQGDPKPIITAPASTGFASYSSKDRQRVLDRTAEIRRSGFDLWLDCLDLRPGEEWKPKIEQEIKNRDLFLLFWSANAKKSKWVRWEWKTALKEKGLSSIEAHPLDPESDAQPPKELTDLHFGDPLMLVRKALEESS